MNKKKILIILLFIIVMVVLYIPFSWIGLFLLRNISNLEFTYGHCVNGICAFDQNLIFEDLLRLIGLCIFIAYIYVCYKLTSYLIKKIRV